MLKFEYHDYFTINVIINSETLNNKHDLLDFKNIKNLNANYTTRHNNIVFLQHTPTKQNENR